ncbi:MAG TPA: SDR family oxidoreductase [Brevefilum sp.]|nr:SDR family oxidoreductase [Brevefilum sp.]HOR18286.1 SDR family oxidoreductase [Brevefilum sp.]
MRILLTGVAGFLGSHLADRLLAEGHVVIGMDNFITGNRENIVHLNENLNFSFIFHDVSNFILLTSPIDYVVHFASPASPNPASPLGYPNLPIQTLKAGALGTHNTLGVARAFKSKFLLASTSEIYGDPLEHPQKETYRGNVDPIGTRSVYDEAKRFAEALTMAYHRFHNIDTHIVRIFNTYGPRMRIDDGRAIPNFLLQAMHGEPLTIYGDGYQTRSFCYVDDLIEGIYRLMMSDYHAPVNIGNPAEISIRELANLVNELTGNPSGIVEQAEKRLSNDPQRRQPDITLARAILGWEPKTSLREGLKLTIPHFKN